MMITTTKTTVISILVALLLSGAVHSYQPCGSAGGVVSSRRAWFEKAAFVVAGGATAALMTSNDNEALAMMESCPKGSNNCIRTLWTPPPDVKDVGAAVVDILNTYPQEGQQGVDKGGWSIVQNDLGATSGSAKVEFKSGIGNAARFLNGGKPFVDDLLLQVDGDGVVQVRSSSRVGDTDFGVNQKRLQYLTERLREKGWTVPDPTY